MKKILTKSEKKVIISETENAIINNFVKIFNSIKRIDENNLPDINKKGVVKKVSLPPIDSDEDLAYNNVLKKSTNSNFLSIVDYLRQGLPIYKALLKIGISNKMDSMAFQNSLTKDEKVFLYHLTKMGLIPSDDSIYNKRDPQDNVSNYNDKYDYEL